MRVDERRLHDENFYTITDVSQLLRISERHLRRLIRSGRLKAIRVGLRALRIREADLSAFLAGTKRPRT